MPQHPRGIIGAGDLAATGRQILKEVQAAYHSVLYSDSNIAQHPDLRTAGEPLPSEIAAAREAEARSNQERDSTLEDRLNQGKSREDPDRGDRGIDRE